MNPKIENERLVVRCQPGGEVVSLKLDDIRIVLGDGETACFIFTKSGFARRVDGSRESVLRAAGRIYPAVHP